MLPSCKKIKVLSVPTREAAGVYNEDKNLSMKLEKERESMLASFAAMLQTAEFMTTVPFPSLLIIMWGAFHLRPRERARMQEILRGMVT